MIGGDPPLALPDLFPRLSVVLPSIFASCVAIGESAGFASSLLSFIVIFTQRELNRHGAVSRASARMPIHLHTLQRGAAVSAVDTTRVRKERCRLRGRQVALGALGVQSVAESPGLLH